LANDENFIVIDQYPKPGEPLVAGERVILYRE